jgi:ATP-dependent DNA ligase
MAEQLSLQLPPTSVRLPRTLRPMLAQPAAHPFDSPDHLFEPLWGGRRALAFVEPDAAGRPALTRLLDADGRDLAPLVPEAAAIAGLVVADSAVLDGELVVVDRIGRCDGFALDGRLRGRPGPAVAFLAFDALYQDGRPLLGQPLERRRAALRRILRPGEAAIAIPSIVGEGVALSAAVEEAGIAGVLARVRRGPYLPGIRSRLWRWVPRGTSPEESPSTASGTADAGLEGDAQSTDMSATMSTVPPVLALIRRLPIDDAE